MKRAALASLMVGTVFSPLTLAGGGGAPLSEWQRPLLGLSGQAFDEAWLVEMSKQQSVLQGIAELEKSMGEYPAWREWAGRDSVERWNTVERLFALRSSQESWSITRSVLEESDAGPVTGVEGILLESYTETSPKISALAQLALAKSHNGAIRGEASTILRYEYARLKELKKLRHLLDTLK